MTAVLNYLALLLTAAGFVSAATVLVTTRRWMCALAVLLDFLLASGLLRLAAPPTWQALATAAGTLVVRQIALRGLRRGAGIPGFGLPRRKSPG